MSTHGNHASIQKSTSAKNNNAARGINVAAVTIEICTGRTPLRLKRKLRQIDARVAAGSDQAG
jgi:hypothetical protein